MALAIVPTCGWLRLLRGTAVALVATLLAAVGHASAGGAVPNTGLLVVLGMLMAGLMSVLADRRSAPATVLAILGVSQLALHGLLQVMAVHDHSVVAAVAPPADGAAMTVVHAVATLVSAVLLARAENVVFAVAAALGRVVPRRLAPLPARRPLRRLVQTPAPVRPMRSVLLVCVLGRRGPPVLG